MACQIKKRDLLIRVEVVDFIPHRNDRKTRRAPRAVSSPKGMSLPLEQAVGKEFFRGSTSLFLRKKGSMRRYAFYGMLFCLAYHLFGGIVTAQAIGLGFSPQDCRALAAQDFLLCQSQDCRAALKKDPFLCQSQDCRAWAQQDPHLCQSQDCRALLQQDPLLCQSSFCRAWVYKNPLLCP